MALVLGDLIQTLVTKDGKEKMTKEEGQFFLDWRAKTIKSCIVVGSAATGLFWIATTKRNPFCPTLANRFRLILAGGAGSTAGYWRLRDSLNTCVDQVLGLDGSRMQRELKKIVVKRYGDDPRRMQPFAKHFYCEEVYNDSNPQHPKLVYRPRSVFMDTPVVANENVYGSSDADGKQQHYNQRSNDPNSFKRPTMETKQVRINPGISVSGYGDPLDLMLGYTSANEDVQQPDASEEATKVQGRNSRRNRRKQRMRVRRDPLSLNEAAA